MMAISPSTDEQLDREVQNTLELIDSIRERNRREDAPGWVLMRAARACWVIGNDAWARDFYERAAISLREYTLETGRRTGTVEQYADLALRAAWMVGDRDLLTETGRAIDIVCEQMINSLELPPDPLIRVGLLLTRLRAAWYRGQSVLIREYEPEIDRRATGLDAWSKASWQASRGPATVAAIKAIIALRPEPGRPPPPLPLGQPSRTTLALQAVGALDRFLTDHRARPPLVSEFVDEELISLVAALKDHNLTPPPMRSAIEPRR